MAATSVAAFGLSLAPPASRAVSSAIAAAPPSASAFAAAAAWVSAHKVTAIASVLVAIPAVALLEAGYFVLQYRSKHGSAPCPIVPSHGIVTVGGTVNAFPPSSSAFLDAVESGSRRLAETEGGAIFGEDVTATVLESVDDGTIEETTGPPLRLLVIGDSLAAGIGTSQSCTPVLPQSIATCLSRDMGRPVQWTCLGEPGASAGWIARTLETFRDGREGDRRISGANTKPPNLQEDDGNDGKHWDDWLRERLNILGHQLLDTDSDDVGQFDVAVVLTGSNDLKFAVLPFMFREQKRKESVGSGEFAAELQSAVDAVASKMKAGIRESIERVRTSVEESFETIRTSVEEVLPSDVLERMNWANMTGGGLEGEAIVPQDQRRIALEKNATEMSSTESPQETGSSKREGRPLVILPALPARNLPVSRWIPLRWIGLSLLGIIEQAKKKLSGCYPGAIVFVDAPERTEFEQFERQEGPLWEKRQSERDVVSLTDVPKNDCQRLMRQMREYCDAEGKNGSHANGLEQSTPKGSHKFRPKFGWKRKRHPPGVAFLAADMIHPNDKGYDFWGRFIAAKIVEEWEDTGK